MKRTTERGAVLVEFALVALTLSLLLGATIEFGRLLFYAQALQDVARVAARELSVTPLPAPTLFADALADANVVARIYDKSRLVVDVTGWTDADFDTYIHSPDLPLVNRALLPLMIVEQFDGGLTLWRYPGALLNDTASPTGLTVGIPRVARDPGGAETITWVPVIEEIRCDPNDPGSGVFSVAPPTAPCALASPTPPPRGLVALRINYPYQAGAMTAHVPNPEGPAEPTLGNPIEVNEALGSTNEPEDVYGPTVSLMPAEAEDAPFPRYPIYSGRYGLGRQLAYGGRTVRPYRKLLSAQAIYRREVIGD